MVNALRRSQRLKLWIHTKGQWHSTSKCLLRANDLTAQAGYITRRRGISWLGPLYATIGESHLKRSCPLNLLMSCPAIILLSPSWSLTQVSSLWWVFSTPLPFSNFIFFPTCCHPITSICPNFAYLCCSNINYDQLRIRIGMNLLLCPCSSERIQIKFVAYRHTCLVKRPIFVLFVNLLGAHAGTITIQCDLL